MRVIATSNRDLPQAVAGGEFREDLFYRIAVFPLAWLPLRERVADIVPLAKRLLAVHASKQGRKGVRFSDCAQRALLGYAWPGNVRELDNVVQRALILQMGELLSADDLGLHGFALLGRSTAPVKASVESENVSVEPSTVSFVAPDEVVLPPAAELEDDVRRHEFRLIAQALQAEQGRRERTAERLGISPRTLRYKLAQMRELTEFSALLES